MAMPALTYERGVHRRLCTEHGPGGTPHADAHHGRSRRYGPMAPGVAMGSSVRDLQIIDVTATATAFVVKARLTG